MFDRRQLQSSLFSNSAYMKFTSAKIFHCRGNVIESQWIPCLFDHLLDPMSLHKNLMLKLKDARYISILDTYFFPRK